MTDARTEIHDKTFDAPVDTDGNHFINCRFNGVQLRYGGGQLPNFENCFFDGVSWYFHDAALRTIQLLQVNGNEEGGRGLIDQLFAPGYYIGE